MTELSYSKSFLTMLAQRPTRLTADYVEDPRKLPARNLYTLPKTLPEKKKRKRDDTSDATVNVTLKPLRPNPALSPLSLDKTPLSSTILTLKAKYSSATGNAPDRLRLQYKGKPLQDVKTLQDLDLQDGDNVTITLMLMGGAGAAPVEETKAARIKVLETEAFWRDLKKFLESKLGTDSEESVDDVYQTFRNTWKK